MVSLVAEEVVNTSFSVTFPGGQSPKDSFEGISVPALTVSGLTGFTYVESMLISLDTGSISGDSDFIDQSFEVDLVSPEANFNGVDVLPEKNSSRIFDFQPPSGNFTFRVNDTAPLVIDSYIDTPLTLSPSFSAGQTQGVVIDSQTSTFDIIIKVVGRKP